MAYNKQHCVRGHVGNFQLWEARRGRGGQMGKAAHADGPQHSRSSAFLLTIVFFCVIFRPSPQPDLAFLTGRCLMIGFLESALVTFCPRGGCDLRHCCVSETPTTNHC